MKNSYRRSSHVNLFARFLNLIQDSDQHPDPGKEDDSESSHKTENNLAPTASKRKRNGYLNLSFLHVFLTARYYLLRPPPPLPLKAKAKKNAARLNAADPHVIQVEPTKKWVSLDHTITLLKWYISSHLPEDSVVSYCREVEHSTAIYAGRALTEVSGNRLAVRAEMRRVMLLNDASGGGGGDASATSANELSEKDRKGKPRIVADVHKVLLLLLDALEQRQEVMAKDLIALFDAVAWSSSFWILVLAWSCCRQET